MSMARPSADAGGSTAFDGPVHRSIRTRVTNRDDRLKGQSPRSWSGLGAAQPEDGNIDPNTDLTILPICCKQFETWGLADLGLNAHLIVMVARSDRLRNILKT
jgi:hypothetical protein